MTRWLLIAWLLLPVGAHATPVEAVISEDLITMDASFTGTKMFYVGARNDNGDIVVVVRGPQKNYMVRKKEKILGMWLNHDRMKFFNVPSYYALASNKPLSDIEQTALFAQLGIGHDNLFMQHSFSADTSKVDAFSQALLDYQIKQRLYTKEPIALSGGERLLKALIAFPDTIPTGEYTAEIYLVSDGEVTGMQSNPIHVIKSGLDAVIYNYAHNQPEIYGIIAIFMAFSIGWLGGRIFNKG
ncbi:MAG: TIGR02186 family protein [Rickettsiales bacterium]|nr:TIGR02186 family protein [Rickettsiales bacterium]